MCLGTLKPLELVHKPKVSTLRFKKYLVNSRVKDIKVSFPPHSKHPQSPLRIPTDEYLFIVTDMKHVYKQDWQD